MPPTKSIHTPHAALACDTGSEREKRKRTMETERKKTEQTVRIR